MRVDLHSHCREHSACSLMAAQDLVCQARRKGLDAIAITDHHHFLGDEERDALEEAAPGIRVLRGIEIAIEQAPGNGLSDDLLVIAPEPPPLPSPLAVDQLERLAEYVRRTGALTVLAHPFRFHRHLAFSLERFTPDAAEIGSVNILPRLRRRIIALTRRHGMWPVVGSDAHSLPAIGTYYLELDKTVGDEAGLARQIRAGRYAMKAHLPSLRSWARQTHRPLGRAVLSWAAGQAG